MSEKLYRQGVIKEIISKNEINSQEDLIKLLTKEDISITQATLSRDFRELKISKIPNSKGEYIYQLTENESQDFSSAMDTIAFSGNLAVLKTQPGFATRIALEIDQTPHSDIMGTIAGDDTIFIALKENHNQESIIEFTHKIIPTIKVQS